MTAQDIREIAELLNKLAELFDEFADLAEAQAIESYAAYQRTRLFQS